MTAIITSIGVRPLRATNCSRRALARLREPFGRPAPNRLPPCFISSPKYLLSGMLNERPSWPSLGFPEDTCARRVSRCRYLGLAGSSYYLSFSEIRPPDRANRHFAGYRTNVVHFWQIAKISYQALN